MTKKLVAFFSASGKTRTKAEELAQIMEADLFEIEPQEKYTNADLDWTNTNSRSSLEMKDKNSRPAIHECTLDLDQYDTIYIGFPIWWYTAPTIINTFIESVDLSGKEIYLFATSGGSGINKALRDLSTLYPNYSFKKGILVSGKVDWKSF